MGKNIDIRLDQTDLVRGQKARVKVRIRFDKPTKVRGIRAQFHGFEKTKASYTTTETGADGKTKTVTRTATEYVDIVKEDFLLLGDDRKGFFSRIGDSMATMVGGGDHELVEPGEKEFTIDVEIPHDAPASFEGKLCEVTYNVSVSVDVPIKIDWHESTSLDLAPTEVEFQDTKPVHVVYPDDTGRSFMDKTFGKDVRLNLAVDRDTLKVGEVAMAMLTVETPEPLKVDKIEVLLVGIEKSIAQGHEETHNHQHLVCQLDSPGVISNDSVNEFEILIPQLEAPHSQTGKNFGISWQIQVRLYVPWAKDPTLKAPIRILPGGVPAKGKDSSP